MRGSHPYVVQDQNQGQDVLYMAYSGENDHFNGCSVAESTDGGLSWTPLVLVLAPYNSTYFGRPALVSVGNTLVMLYCSAPTGAYCTYSLDGGHKWQNGVETAIYSVGACNNCALAYHKGVLYAAARTHGMYSSGPIIGVLTASSTDMGVHWQPTGVLPDERGQRLLRAVMQEGACQDVLAEREGLSQSWVSRLIAEALVTLRGLLESDPVLSAEFAEGGQNFGLA